MQAYLVSILQNIQEMKNFISFYSFRIARDHLTDSEAVCFRICVCFCKVCRHTYKSRVLANIGGAIEAAHTLAKTS